MRRPLILLIAIALATAACGGDDSATPTTAATVAGGGSGSGGSGGGSVSTATPPKTAPSTTTTLPATTTTTEAPADTGTMEVPLEAGTAITVGDWQVTVLSSFVDANEAVMAENSFNDPPAEGRTFSMVRVAATYLGEESEIPLFGLTFGAVGTSGRTYDFEDDCGVTPDPLPTLTEVFPGGSVAGNLCWAVADEDLGTLVLTAEPAFSLSGQVFLLEVPAEGVVFDAPPSVGIVADDGEGGSRGNPIAVGEPTLVGTWEITVTGSTPDATEAVITENQFNDPPATGRQFLMVEVSATNRGIGSESPFEALTFSAVGPAAVAYGFDDDCGVTPDPFPKFDEVPAGGTVSGNLCWSVTPTDAASLLLIADAASSVEGVRTFLQIP